MRKQSLGGVIKEEIESIEIGSGITYVGAVMFYGTSASTITIAGTVTGIGEAAFYDNEKVTALTIPEGVEEIGKNAFTNCISLKTLELPSTITSIGEKGVGYYYSDITSGYEVVMKLGYLTISGPDNTVTQQYCDDAGLVYFCPSNIKGNLGDNITYSFDITTGTLTISGTGEMPDSERPWSDYASEITSVVVKTGITTIGKSNLGTTSLKSFSVEAGNDYYCSNDGVLYNADMTELVRCPIGKTGSFQCPATVTKIDNYAFYSSRLTKLYLQDNIQYVYASAFKSSKLKYIEFASYPVMLSEFALKTTSADSYLIAYHSSQTSWATKISTLSSYANIVWYDLDTVLDEKAFSSTSIALTSGETYKLSLADGSDLSTFEFYTDSPNVAVVSTDGTVLACGNGTATITGYSEVFAVTITCTVKVTGYTDSESIYSYTELAPGEINYTSGYAFYLDSVNENVNGYYYINDVTLYFHSFYNDQYVELYDFGSLVDAYIQGNILYVLKTEDKIT